MKNITIILFILIVLLIYNISEAYDNDNRLLNCIINVESKGILNSVSKTNDYGLGQINKRAWPQYDSEKLISDYTYSINATKEVIAYYHRKVGHRENWICAYNVGLTAFNKNTKPTACLAYINKIHKCMNSGAVAKD